MGGPEAPTGSADLRHLPLREEHVALGARFSPFAGWEMPLTYGSIIAEHLQVRTRAGLFDVSHMGRLLLRGPGALATVQNLVASDLFDLGVGQARYTVMLTPWGGIQDDLIVYRRDDGILLIVNAARTTQDREWIEGHLLASPALTPGDPGLELDDLTDLTCLLALQGPAALGILDSLTPGLDSLTPGLAISSMPSFSFARAKVAGVEATVMRTGYTGETGAELLVAAQDAGTLWGALLAAGTPGTVAPCGLGARDTLRLEAALLLYGQDITKNTTPFEARLGWLTQLERPRQPEFVGRQALLEAAERGPEKVLVGLVTDAHAIPRHGDDIAMGDSLVGRVTSGTHSPILDHPIALGYLMPEHTAIGTEVMILVGEKEVAARVVERPFYRAGVTPIPEARRRVSRPQASAQAEELS
jgi:aminomethyltransferase